MPIRTPAPSSPSSEFPAPSLTQRGQVIIEYILLLLVALGLATMIMKSVVSRNPEEPGFLMKRWHEMLKQVAADDPNKRGS